MSEELLASERVKIIDLMALFRGAALRGHSLFVVQNPSAASFEESRAFDAWASGLTPVLQREVGWLRERLRLIQPNAVTRGATTIAVQEPVEGQATRDRDVVLDLSEAIRVAALPLFILVEDGLSDAAFVRRTLPAMWRRKFREWEKTGAVRFEHGGGIAAMKRIVEHCAVDGATADPLGLGGKAWRASHFLLSDRDSQDRDGKLSKAAGGLERMCERVAMKRQLHILRRRDQESYLPKESLVAIIEKKVRGQERIDAKAKLDSHFSDLKTRRHDPLPNASWFKNAFLQFESAIAWEDAWFSRDDSGSEMIDLAEAIAAFI